MPAPWMLAGVAAILLLAYGVAAWRRRHPTPAAEPQGDAFDAELEAARNQVLADPRVAADVIRLWMRA
jgi:flagellar M-ring protein FliF